MAQQLLPIQLSGRIKLRIIKMKKLEYRCDRCLIIEEKWYLSSHDPTNRVLCHLCGGPALRIPLSESNESILENGNQ